MDDTTITERKSDRVLSSTVLNGGVLLYCMMKSLQGTIENYKGYQRRKRACEQVMYYMQSISAGSKRAIGVGD